MTIDNVFLVPFQPLLAAAKQLPNSLTVWYFLWPLLIDLAELSPTWQPSNLILFMNFVLWSKTNKYKSTEILPPLLTTLNMRNYNAESQKNSSNGELWKKTRVLCWSIYQFSITSEYCEKMYHIFYLILLDCCPRFPLSVITWKPDYQYKDSLHYSTLSTVL